MFQNISREEDIDIQDEDVKLNKKEKMKEALKKVF